MSGLSGKRIVVTRPRAQAVALCTALEAHGAQPIIFPAIVIAPLADYRAFDAALARLATYDWVIFTSANGVAAFWERLTHTGLTATALAHTRIAAIGPATARALETHGLSVHFMPDEYVAERIAAGLGTVTGQRILLPRADLAREALAVLLTAQGAHIEELAAYRTLPDQPDAHARAELARGVDAVTFTSASTVRNFLHLTGGLAPDVCVACIGPITADAARAAGLSVTVQASEYTSAGLVAALDAYFASVVIAPPAGASPAGASPAVSGISGISGVPRVTPPHKER